MAVRNILTGVSEGMACVVLLSLVCATSSGLPNAETIGQWVWFDKAALAAAFCFLVSWAFRTKREGCDLENCISWALIFWGGVETAWGVCQLYGFIVSRHSLFALTGSFFNPGPYSGYLAMVLPLCLHQWMIGCKKEKKTAEYVVSGGVGLLIVCALPAGMSRSAWLAAGVSCLWVYGLHKDWKDRLCTYWRWHKGQMAMTATGGLCVLALAGGLLFALKPDSARGRLFMWRMTCMAIAEKPLTGHGVGLFAAAYGNAQEAYFAAGDYEEWEERVAGSPEYAFNEYLQMAVELGIPLALCLLGIVVLCLCVGMRKGRYGICGAILSLMVFSFSSYPLQLPVFIVTSVALLAACVSDSNRWQWLILAIVVAGVAGFRLKNDLRVEQACREWMNAKVLYNAGASQVVEKDYERLYPLLKERAAFLFEYGHVLHKAQKFEASNLILKEALQRSNDPMILNIIGKNYQQTGGYRTAEKWFIRSIHYLPGRIYPYYLLAKLYAEPDFRQPEKFKKMKQIVLTKEPKVHSTAIRQMREEMRKME